MILNKNCQKSKLSSAVLSKGLIRKQAKTIKKVKNVIERSKSNFHSLERINRINID